MSTPLNRGCHLHNSLCLAGVLGHPGPHVRPLCPATPAAGEPWPTPRHPRLLGTIPAPLWEWAWQSLCRKGGCGGPRSFCRHGMELRRPVLNPWRGEGGIGHSTLVKATPTVPMYPISKPDLSSQHTIQGNPSSITRKTGLSD